MHSTDAAYCYRRDGVVVSLSVCLSVFVLVTTTEALPVIKPEATAMLIIARWSLENSLKVRWAQGLHTEILVFYVTADDTSLVISDDLLRRNQSQRGCFAVIGWQE